VGGMQHRGGIWTGPHPEEEKLRVLKEHELGVSLEYDRDEGLFYVPEAEK
jgi:hypothetical protein